MSDNIMVSICCLAYNHEKYIRKTLEGFVNQKTNFKYEVIIHDDASTDKTQDIIREYEKKYPGLIKPIYQTENQFSKRVPITRMYIYPKAKGKYFAYCEGDDYWCDENKLQLQFEAMQKTPKASMCVHDVRVIDENGKLTSSTLPKQPVDIDKFSAKDFLALRMNPTVQLWFQTSSYFVFGDYIRQLCKDVPQYMINKEVGDLPLLLYLISKGDIIYVKKEMSHYRQNVPGSWTLKTTKNEETKIKMLKGIIDIYRQYNVCTNNQYYELINGIILIYQFEIFKINPNEFSCEFIVKDKLYERNYHYFSTIMSMKKKIALWGNGIWGQNMRIYLNEYGIDIAYIIDSNAEIYGRFVENIPIVDFKTVKNECDVIIVAINNRETYKEIKDKIYRESPWIEVKFFAEFLIYEE